MRSIPSTVALVATAALLVCATPAFAKSKPRPPQNPIQTFMNFLGGGPSNYGGGHGHGHGHGGGHDKKTYVDIPGTPAIPGTKATETVVYFGTCNNLAGMQQAGNADENGFCLPFASLVGSEGSAGSPGSGPSCAVTSRSGPSPMTRGRNSGSSETPMIVPGTCDSVKAAEEPPNWPPYNGTPNT